MFILCCYYLNMSLRLLFCLLTMQRYGDFLPTPKKISNSSLTCLDKHAIFGQITEKCQKIVQTFVFYGIFMSHGGQDNLCHTGDRILCVLCMK